MSDAFQPDLDFEATREAVQTGEALIVDLDAYEGPLDVLLALARAQKVDLMQVSIAKLADQYLAFVRQARRQRPAERIAGVIGEPARRTDAREQRGALGAEAAAITIVRVTPRAQHQRASVRSVSACSARSGVPGNQAALT